MYSQHQGHGFELIGVSIDADKRAFERMVAAKKINWPQILDGKSGDGPVARLFNLRGTPLIYLIDRDGKIAAKGRSAEPMKQLISAAAQR
jgi:hypothetical protein